DPIGVEHGLNWMGVVEDHERFIGRLQFVFGSVQSDRPSGNAGDAVEEVEALEDRNAGGEGEEEEPDGDPDAGGGVALGVVLEGGEDEGHEDEDGGGGDEDVAAHFGGGE